MLLSHLTTFLLALLLPATAAGWKVTTCRDGGASGCAGNGTVCLTKEHDVPGCFEAIEGADAFLMSDMGDCFEMMPCPDPRCRGADKRHFSDGFQDRCFPTVHRMASYSVMARRFECLAFELERGDKTREAKGGRPRAERGWAA